MHLKVIASITLIIWLLGGTGYAQPCESYLNELQSDYYHKHPNRKFYLHREVDRVALADVIEEWNGSWLRLFFDESDFWKMYDSLGVDSFESKMFVYFKERCQLFFGDSTGYDTTFSLKNIPIGSLPNYSVQASTEVLEDCHVVLFNIDALIGASEFAKLLILANSDKNGNIVFGEHKIKLHGKNTACIENRLNRILTHFVDSTELPEPLLLDCQPLLLRDITYGSNFFFLAHEYSHIILRHDPENASRSKVWQQELDADLLGMKMYLAALIRETNSGIYNPNYMFAAPSAALGLLCMVENEIGLKKRSKSYSIDSFVVDEKKMFNAFQKLVKFEGDHYWVSAELDSCILDEKFDYPPAKLRLAYLYILLELLYPQNKTLPFVKSGLKNLEMLWARKIE